MDNRISIVGRWHGHGNDGFEYNFNFGSDGVVTWGGEATIKSFRCTGVYQLDEKLVPAVLQVTNVEIVEIHTDTDEQIPIIAEDVVIRVYQEFDGEAYMRMKGMPVNPANEPPPYKISDSPSALVLKRL